MRPPLDRAQLLAAGLTTLGMVATPLNRQGGAVRRVLSSVVVGGLFSATMAGAARSWGPARALAAAGTVTSSTALIERVGTSSGWPFGGYRYSTALQPRVAGVPVIVPLAWFAMALPARETASAILGPNGSRTQRIVVGSAALTAWDLFLDPQMTGEGYWQWTRPGRYRGIPMSNYLGWFVTGLGVMAMLEAILPAHDAEPDQVATYGFMAGMETLGFAAFFRDRVVALVGGAAMLPLAAAATARLVTNRR